MFEMSVWWKLPRKLEDNGAESISFQIESLPDFDGCNKNTIKNGMVH